MSLEPPINFSVSSATGQKVFSFAKNPNADSSIFFYNDNGTWTFLGESTTDSFTISGTVTGIHETTGQSTKSNDEPPIGPPKFENVNYGS